MSNSSSSIPDDVHVHSSLDSLAREVSSLLVTASQSALEQRNAFHVGISGGSLPATLGKALDMVKEKIDFTNWHWWMIDERCVKLDDKESNYLELKKNVLQPLNIREKNVHPIDEDKIGNPKEVHKTTASWQWHIRE